MSGTTWPSPSRNLEVRETDRLAIVPYDPINATLQHILSSRVANVSIKTILGLVNALSSTKSTLAYFVTLLLPSREQIEENPEDKEWLDKIIYFTSQIRNARLTAQIYKNQFESADQLKIAFKRDALIKNSKAFDQVITILKQLTETRKDIYEALAWDEDLLASFDIIPENSVYYLSLEQMSMLLKDNIADFISSRNVEDATSPQYLVEKLYSTHLILEEVHKTQSNLCQSLLTGLEKEHIYLFDEINDIEKSTEAIENLYQHRKNIAEAVDGFFFLVKNRIDSYFDLISVKTDNLVYHKLDLESGYRESHLKAERSKNKFIAKVIELTEAVEKYSNRLAYQRRMSASQEIVSYAAASRKEKVTHLTDKFQLSEQETELVELSYNEAFKEAVELRKEAKEDHSTAWKLLRSKICSLLNLRGKAFKNFPFEEKFFEKALKIKAEMNNHPAFIHIKDFNRQLEDIINEQIQYKTTLIHYLFFQYDDIRKDLFKYKVEIWNKLLEKLIETQRLSSTVLESYEARHQIFEMTKDAFDEMEHLFSVFYQKVEKEPERIEPEISYYSYAWSAFSYAGSMIGSLPGLSKKDEKPQYGKKDIFIEYPPAVEIAEEARLYYHEAEAKAREREINLRDMNGMLEILIGEKRKLEAELGEGANGQKTEELKPVANSGEEY